jgi:pantothenate kinase
VAETQSIHVWVDAGICGFRCSIEATPEKKRNVRLVITESECKQIRHLSRLLQVITLKDLFLPLSRNPVFVSAERAGCHTACPIPSALVKAAEVAMGIALPKSVRIDFEKP